MQEQLTAAFLSQGMDSVKKGPVDRQAIFKICGDAAKLLMNVHQEMSQLRREE